MSDEYASLKNVAWQYRFAGWLVGIVIVGWGLFISYGIYRGLGPFTDETGKVIGSISCLCITALITWLVVASFRAVSEFIYLCIRVEYNTRTRPQPQIVHPQPTPQMVYQQQQPQLNAPANYQQPVPETQQVYEQPVQETPQQYTADQAEYYMPPENTEEQQ